MKLFSTTHHALHSICYEILKRGVVGLEDLVWAMKTMELNGMELFGAFVFFF